MLFLAVIVVLVLSACSGQAPAEPIDLLGTSGLDPYPVSTPYWQELLESCRVELDRDPEPSSECEGFLTRGLDASSGLIVGDLEFCNAGDLPSEDGYCQHLFSLALDICEEQISKEEELASWCAGFFASAFDRGDEAVLSDLVACADDDPDSTYCQFLSNLAD
jgi:hypothetical protein